MADASSRIINIIKKLNVDTKSYLVGLTVQSINPLILTRGDKLVIPEDFVYFDSYIDTSKISIGDKFDAISLNDDQLYYIVDIISSTNELDKYIQRIKRIEDRLN